MLSQDGLMQVAAIVHQWDEIIIAGARTGSYILCCKFPSEADEKMKALLLGAAFLIVSSTLYLQRKISVNRIIILMQEPFNIHWEFKKKKNLKRSNCSTMELPVEVCTMVLCEYREPSGRLKNLPSLLCILLYHFRLGYKSRS